MIEDMYKEETGDLEIDSSLENPPKDQDGVHSTGNGENSQNTATERCQVNQISDLTRSNIMPGMDTAGAGAKDYYMNLKMRSTTEECTFVQDALAHIDGTGRFMAYQMADLGHGGGGGVSLTLGLQHCDGGLPGSSSQQSLVGLQGGDIYSAAAAIGADTAEYDWPEGVTGPCGSDSSKRPPRSRHQSPSTVLAAVRGCKLDASSSNSNSCLVTTVVAMVDIPVDDVKVSEGRLCVGVEAKGGRGRARYMERRRSCMALKST
ncbi:hypothetical protein GW17_00028341 [Ensete ventricosum]|nr:hypothetical protein GW17_00028341 [Ensete ventricosum]